jgi:protein required for attachment to host cells
MKTWIVVAHRGGARLLLQEDDGTFEVLESMDNPEGRREGAGEVPRAPDSHRSTKPSEPRDSQRSHAAKTFASELAHKLQHGRIEQSYDELVLIAAPRFLGALRNALDGATAARVRGTLDKDFAGLKDHELVKRLEAL